MDSMAAPNSTKDGKCLVSAKWSQSAVTRGWKSELGLVPGSRIWGQAKEAPRDVFFSWWVHEKNA